MDYKQLQPGDQVSVEIHNLRFVGVADGVAHFDVAGHDGDPDANCGQLTMTVDSHVHLQVRKPDDWNPPVGSTWVDRHGGYWFITINNPTRCSDTMRTIWMAGVGGSSSISAFDAWKNHGPLRQVFIPPPPPTDDEPTT